jgi:hypothetical protein
MKQRARTESPVARGIQDLQIALLTIRHQLKEESMSIGRTYLLPLGLGFIGMFICHIFILVGFGCGIQYPIYIVTYPIIYPLLAAILVWGNPKPWATDAVLVLVLPFVYWYLLLWSDGKFNLEAALKWRESSGMLLIMLATIAVTIALSFVISRRRKKAAVRPENGGGA